jgi:UDP-GlcNAc:undecaprenyl-phosphate/decaprenyl-phosphate GlcNAc-1-phosphate transferase
MVIAIVFLVALIGTIVINRLLLVFSKNLGVRGPERTQVRWALTTKPSLGGFAFYIVFLGIIGVTGLMDLEYIYFTKKQLIGIFIAITCGFGIGFADDTYNTNPKLKALGQLSCAVIIFLFDIQIEIVKDATFINFIVTSLWTVGLMNSINMLDNMDGITASSSLMIVLIFIVVLAFNNTIDLPILLTLTALCGSIFGFLYHNWFPSKLYMGDAGSQFLGIFLAIFSIPFVWNNSLFSLNSSFFSKLLAPTLVFIIPLIDTATVVFYRLKRKSSPFIGGADHTTHHLVYLGLTERQVAMFFITCNIIGGGLIYYICNNDDFSYITQTIVLLYIIVLFATIEYAYLKGKKKPKKVKNKIVKMRSSIYDKLTSINK